MDSVESETTVQSVLKLRQRVKAFKYLIKAMAHIHGYVDTRWNSLPARCEFSNNPDFSSERLGDADDCLNDLRSFPGSHRDPELHPEMIVCEVELLIRLEQFQEALDLVNKEIGRSKTAGQIGLSTTSSTQFDLEETLTLV